ncbi:MAG: hypothetical protein IKL40_03870 [Clostridia bacterium]|nr:hypothetical protein [Clostridia bacterium]
MRSIEDGYSYEFYSYIRDIPEYLERKSEYEEELREREYWERKCSLSDDDFERTFSGGEF